MLRSRSSAHPEKALQKDRKRDPPEHLFCKFGSDSDGLDIELDMVFIDPNACLPFHKIVHIDQTFHGIVSKKYEH